MAQLPRFARQNDEDRLRDFLGMVRVARLPERHGINQVDMPRHQGGESFPGIVPGILAQQHAVIR